MANVYDSDFVVSEFKLQLDNYAQFRTNSLEKSYKFPYLPTIGKIVSQLFFNKDDFGIKYLTEVDMPLNKETKPKSPLFEWGCRIRQLRPRIGVTPTSNVNDDT